MEYHSQIKKKKKEERVSDNFFISEIKTWLTNHPEF